MFMMILIGVWCASFGVARVILTTHKKKIQNDRRIMQVLWTKTIKKNAWINIDISH